MTAIFALADTGAGPGVGVSREPVATDAPPDFDEFFAGQSDQLVRLGYLLLGDAESARDCAQDVMTAMYARWHRFSTYGQAAGYARTSLVNRTRDHHRRRLVAVRKEPVLEHEAAFAQATHDELGAVVDRSSLWPHLLRLPQRQREVIVLRYWLDLGEAEIARTLEVRPGTVKTSASRGLRALRRMMSEER